VGVNMANNIHQLKILLFYPITAHVTTVSHSESERLDDVEIVGQFRDPKIAQWAISKWTGS